MEIENKDVSPSDEVKNGLAWLQVWEEEKNHKEMQELSVFLHEILDTVKQLKKYPLNHKYYKKTGFFVYVPQGTTESDNIVLTIEDKKNILLKCAAHYEGSPPLYPSLVWAIPENLFGEFKSYPVNFLKLPDEEKKAVFNYNLQRVNYKKGMIAEVNPDGREPVYIIRPYLPRIEEFLKKFPEIKYTVTKKKFSFKSFKGKTKYKNHSIHIGSVEVPIPPSTDQDRFCEIMYESDAREQVEIVKIYQHVASVREVDVYDNSLKIKVRDAMKAVNDKVKEILNTEERLFSSVKGEYIVRYY